jgi:iron complex transport system substrate-binding protein
MRARACLLALALTACAAAPLAPAAPPPRPLRIVSLDYCADQYVLKLVDRSRIAAVSPHADDDFSYMRAAAAGLAQVRPSAEDVIALRPDLVVRAYGGGPGIADALARAGVPVAQLGYAGDFGGIRRTIGEIAATLDEADAGAALIAEIDARLAAVPPGAGATALYYTSGGVTSGPGSLVDEMLRAAGYVNFETRPGWPSIPLERLTGERPDVFAAASFGTGEDGHVWSAARHPVLDKGAVGASTVALEGAWTACGGWFLLDAVEKLAKAREK